MKKVKAGIVQATPVIFDIQHTVDKVISLIKEGAQRGCKLLIFPESFIPGYPRGLSFDTVVGRRGKAGRELWQLFYENSIEVGDQYCQQISIAVKEADVFVVLGVTEKDPINGTLYCSILFFDETGTIIGKHRKLKPTGTERILWGEGDGSTLKVLDTSFGILGGLICWENLMPLARMTLYQQGVQIYVAPTADSRDTWLSTLIHIACEGRCYVIGCNQFVTKSDYPDHLQKEIETEPDIMCRGGSAVISPLGEVLAGPVYDEETIITVELDLDEVSKSKFDFDVIGHYAREDVFDFSWRKGTDI
ncbi:MAG: carbon-nitrogen hydrolase family protein [Bacteroidetes bacterium]|nr:MAG: carbon-nitrogen hydrolase family protein [Bacteroidota bacterium]